MKICCIFPRAIVVTGCIYFRNNNCRDVVDCISSVGGVKNCGSITHSRLYSCCHCGQLCGRVVCQRVSRILSDRLTCRLFCLLWCGAWAGIIVIILGIDEFVVEFLEGLLYLLCMCQAGG